MPRGAEHRALGVGRGLIGALLCVVVWGTAGQASAQGDAREALEQAREHMEAGQSAYQAQRYEQAITEFEAAYAARPFSAFLYNAGVAAEHLEQWSRAADFFERYLTEDPSSSDAAAVRAKVDELRTRALNAAPVEPAVTTTTTVVQRPVDAGAPQGTETGEATESTDAGVPDADADAGAPVPGPSGGETQTAAGQDGGANAVGATASGSVGGLVGGHDEVMKSLLSVQTEPQGATVTLRRGGRVVASGPSPFAQTLDEGEYALTVEHPDYRTVGEHVRVRAGKVYVVIVEMSQGHFLGYLNVTTEPPGAQVFIDDREQGAAGTTPFRTVLDTGSHHVILERPGFGPEEREVEVNVGAEISLRVPLTRVDYGRIRVVANLETASVVVDGEEVGQVPYEGQASAGVHHVVVSGDGMKDFEAEVTVERGRLTPVRVHLRPRPSRRTAYSTLVFGLGSVGAGIYLGLRGNSLRDDLRAERDAGTLASNDPRIRQGRLFYYGADAAFGFGALMGAFSLYYFLRDPLPDSSGRVLERRDWALAPSLGPGGGGAVLRGRF